MLTDDEREEAIADYEFEWRSDAYYEHLDEITENEDEDEEPEMPQPKISRTLAQDVLAWCRERWDPSGEHMFLKPGEDEALAPGTWVIGMEGMSGWPVETYAQVNSIYRGVFAEPLSGWGLALYPPSDL